MLSSPTQLPLSSSGVCWNCLAEEISLPLLASFQDQGVALRRLLRADPGSNFGSDANSMTCGSCCTEQSGLQEIEVAPSIHLAFHQLELRDLPLGLTVRPRLCDSSPDGGSVSGDPDTERRDHVRETPDLTMKGPTGEDAEHHRSERSGFNANGFDVPGRTVACGARVGGRV
jgi:hypothetical protein